MGHQTFGKRAGGGEDGERGMESCSLIGKEFQSCKTKSSGDAAQQCSLNSEH